MSVTSRLQLFVKIVVISLVIVLLLLAICYGVVSRQSKGKVFDSIETIPSVDVGLLLGTSPRTRNGTGSDFFNNRIAAAVALYRSGKIKYIIASGDNSRMSYNEPIYMQRALIRRGISAEHIVLDYAGFSTLDSVIRAKKVFGQSRIIIISQRFHNERAIYIAQRYELDAIAYNARAVGGLAGARTILREIFARVKAMIDVHVFKRQPKFLGSQEAVPSESGEPLIKNNTLPDRNVP